MHTPSSLIPATSARGEENRAVICDSPRFAASNYSDLTRPHPKWWFSKGNPLISGKSRLVKYYNLARIIPFIFGDPRNPNH